MRQNNSVHSLSYRVALGGIIGALCIICLFLTGVFPALYVVLTMLASALVYVMTIETSIYWGLVTYISVGLLSIIIVPNKDSSIIFLLFFGYYPLLRSWMERHKMKFLGFLLRFVIFNVAILALFWVSVYVFGSEELLDTLGDYGKYGGWILLGMANITFLCYDYVMESFPEIYQKRLKPRIFPKK